MGRQEAGGTLILTPGRMGRRLALLTGRAEPNRAEMLETADHISTTERNSADAERDCKTVKLYAYLDAQLKLRKPERYVALITD